VLDHVAGQADAETFLGRELAQDEVFGEIVFQPRPATDCCNGALARDDRGTDGELHAFEETRDQDAGDEFSVHHQGFELGPDAWTGDGAIGASRDGEVVVLFEFGGDGGEELRCDPDV
jgi:hypothetical protein